MTDTTARGAGPAERARHAGEDGPAPERRRRMSARRKQGAVLRLLRMEGCHNVNWVGGEVTTHLHRIIEAIALLGADFTPSREELARALPTKSDRFYWFDADRANGTYEGAFNAPMLWNSNFFMTPEAMKILRLLIDVWLPDFKFGPGQCAKTWPARPGIGRR